MDNLQSNHELLSVESITTSQSSIQSSQSNLVTKQGNKIYETL